jgi:hypothetical protein
MSPNPAAYRMTDRRTHWPGDRRAQLVLPIIYAGCVSRPEVAVIVEEDHVAPLALADLIARQGHELTMFIQTHGPAPHFHILGDAYAPRRNVFAAQQGHALGNRL